MMETTLVSDTGQTIRSFFYWWFTELGSLLPAGTRRALSGRGAAVALRVDEDEIIVSVTAKNGRAELARVRTKDRAQDAIADDLRAVVRHQPLRQSRCELVLTGKFALERSVDLPLDAADNLKEVLAFEMDRLTPFSSEEVYFDYRVTGSDPDLKRLQVVLVIAQRADLDRVTAWARAAGLEPVLASAATSASDDDASLNLLPFEGPRSKGNLLAWVAVALLALFVGLAGAAVYLPLQHGERDLRAARERIGELRIIAAEVVELDRRAAALQERRVFISEGKSLRMPSIEVLDEVTRRIPDSSWLTLFNLRDGKLRIAGYADDPSHLIRLLEESPTLSDVRFVSPVTKDSRVQKDRFNLSADVASNRAP